MTEFSLDPQEILALFKDIAREGIGVITRPQLSAICRHSETDRYDDSFIESIVPALCEVGNLLNERLDDDVAIVLRDSGLPLMKAVTNYMKGYSGDTTDLIKLQFNNVNAVILSFAITFRENGFDKEALESIDILRDVSKYISQRKP